MLIKEIKEKNIWESFLLNCSEKTFLDSFSWGEFQKIMGDKIWRLGIFEGEELIALSLIIKVQAKRATFIFLPHGPIIKAQNLKFKAQILKILLDELKRIAKQEKASFIRISPIWERTEENIQIFKKLGFRTAPIHIHPEVTWELNINESEEQLLMKMRKTTRYLIRNALKNKDIEIYQSQNPQDLNSIDEIYQKTAERHHFTPFSFKYLKNELEVFLPDDQISIFFGKYKNEIISGAMIIFWQGIAFYHQGASSLKYPKIPISYLLQWEAIKEAKKRGCNLYNFWGIADVEGEIKKKHPWRGLSLFKMGFGGEKKEYVKTQDFPLSKKYWLTFVFEKIRKIKRRL